MAYPKPAYDRRSPTEPEHKRPPWDPIPRNPYHAMLPSSASTTPTTVGTTLLDPESEDSDVSITPGDTLSASAIPQSLPPPPPKHILESPDTVQAHLNELSRVEDHNIKKHRRLHEKRARKDERIQRRRYMQDAKIKAIMDARARRDARIDRRRQGEDAAFQRFYDDLEEEENRLRHRLKRLKRGLPVDEQHATGRSISSSSMSPPGPPYSTIPPPAKRHQTGPPGHNGSPLSAANRESKPLQSINPNPGQLPIPNPATPYQFYHSNSAPPPQQQQPPPYQMPYHTTPAYNNSPQSGPHATPLPPRTTSTPAEPLLFSVNGQPPSPSVSRPPLLPPAVAPNVIPPSRQTSANYDTRPPPPNPGFATINHPTPPQSGFAAINARPNETTPIQMMGPAKDGSQIGLHRSHEFTPSRPFQNDATPTSAPGSLLSSSNKRTPSTTHPYQMSEAFANRHHHCEKTDSLNRGIWTWYGPGGTQENPTAPATPMYLKCNHDACGRIDWRTVHGLQCHIVKNHEQPKGTIGSLEKALEKYGVPVKDIEDIEKRDGLGSGGTMADPKNLKLKAKSKEAGEKRETESRSTPTSSGPTPINHRANHIPNFDSPVQSDPLPKPFGARINENSESDSTPPSERHLPNKSAAGFAAVNNTWAGINSTPSKTQEAKTHEKQNATDLQGEKILHSDSPRLPSKGPSPWRSWEVSNDIPKVAREATSTEVLRRPHSSISDEIPVATSVAALTAPSLPIPVTTDPKSHYQASNARILSEQPQHKDLTAFGAKAVQRIDFEPPQKTDDSSKDEDTPMKDIHRDATTLKKSETQDSQGQEQEKTIVTNGADTTKDADEETMKPPLSTSDGARSAMHSPEIPSKRVSAAGSRRGSRRSSMATTGSRTLADKEKEDAIDGNKDQDKDSLVDEDDDQTITVGGTGAFDRTRTPPRRLANGRYMRKAR